MDIRSQEHLTTSALEISALLPSFYAVSDMAVQRAAVPSLARLSNLAAVVVAERRLQWPEHFWDECYYRYDSTYVKGDGHRRFCNWLARGAVMVGRYPFSDPMRNGPSQDDGRTHLKQLINDGVTAFACLQAELPSQSAVWPAGGVSVAPEHEKTLQQAGLISAAPKNFLPYGDVLLEESAKLGYTPPALLHFPIKDMSVPTWDETLCILESMLLHLQDGGCLYVHCWGGLGRAGMLSACTLSLLRPELGPEEILICTQAGYDSRQVGAAQVVRRSPQTWQQRDVVRDFTLRLKEVTGGGTGG